jgi:hypothetical protein
MSQVSESTYYYSKDNRDLYQKTLDQFNDKNCVFSRNLLAFLESPQKEPGPFYSRHVNECPHCQKKVQEFGRTLQTIQELIPDEQPPIDFSQTVRPDIKEAVSFWKKKQKALSDHDKLMKPSFFKRLFIEFFTHGLMSRTFAKGLIWAGLSAVLLFFIF